jgi:gas vesicle protein GvpL/GvpF
VSATVTYLYALARAETVDAAPDVSGVADAPLRTLTHDGVGCYVSSVPTVDFGDDALRVHLEDLAWLERTARQHDRVVQACAQLTTVAPLRLATIFADDQSVLRRLDALRASALDVLAELDGREEWGLKMYAAAPGADADPADAGEASGTAYLRRRQSEHSRRAEAAEHATRDAESVFSSLADLAVRTLRHRPQDQRLTGDPRPMVLNAAFLVDRARVDAFRAAVAALAAQRPPDSVVLTGPWPAYSFASLDES